MQLIIPIYAESFTLENLLRTNELTDAFKVIYLN